MSSAGINEHILKVNITSQRESARIPFCDLGEATLHTSYYLISRRPAVVGESIGLR
mgnify:CR=1 FL=1